MKRRKSLFSILLMVGVAGLDKKYDLVVNAAGPWGKKILVKGTIDKGCFLQAHKDNRIVFVLPYKGQILIETTERKIETSDAGTLCDTEIGYLLDHYNQYFTSKITSCDVVEAFSGVRPIVSSERNFSKASRESCLEKNGKLISVFGGKWTTSRSLAKSVLTKAHH